MALQKFILSKLAAALVILAVVGCVDSALGACSYQITPADRTHGFGATTAKVTVATSGGCNWTVVNNNSWISILAGASGTGNGEVSYVLAGNPNPGTRTGVIRIAGQDFTITQTGVTCTYSISPPDHDKCYGYTTGTVQVSTQSPCPWTIVNTNDWIVITGGNGSTGSDKVFYTVLGNPGTTSRIGVVVIAGQPFTIHQAPYPVSCPADKQVECGAAWNFDAPILNGTNSLTIQTVSTSTNFLCGQSFTAIRTWTVTDRCGNIATCSQTVTAMDVTPPVLTCSANKSVECGAGWSFDLPTVNDGCDGANVTIVVVGTVTNFGCGQSFTATRTWRATDACGNAATCSQTVTATDVTPPVLTCSANKSAECGAGWSFDLPTANDGCDGANVTIVVVGTVTNFGCGQSFTATRTWSATDACGNAATCSQTVTAVDATPPVLTCVAGKSVECGAGWSFDLPTANDGCDGANVTIVVVGTVTNLGCGQSFTATRTWSATDACGNAATCSQTVTAVDATPPVLTCVAGKSVECGAAWSFDLPTANDGCDGANVTIVVVGTVTNLGCGQSFTATRTWSATDACGNAATCSQTVTAVDATPPVLTCVAGKSVECGAAWSFDLPTANDGCDGANVTIVVVGTVTNLGCGQSFTATRTWSATDACGNAATCSQTVTATDVTPPVLTCSANKSVECGAAWSFDLPTANDGCDGANVTIVVVGTVTNLGCGQSFTATRTWSATDACGNTATCSQTVQVINSILVVVCPPNRMVPCTMAWTFDTPGVPGGCGFTITTTSTTTNVLCGATYNATRSWMITDGCVTNICTQIVEVRDQTPPTIFCPPDITVTNADEAPHCPKTLTEFVLGGGQIADDCSAVHYRCADQIFVAGPCGGVIERIHVAYDACGNTNFCIQRIIVLGSTDVSISVQAADTNADICLGGTLTFCVTASGSGPFFYNWMLDGMQIMGADASCLTVTNLNPIDVGRYTVQVISQCETVTKPLSLPGCGTPQPLIAGIQFVPAGVRLTFKGIPERSYQILRGSELNKPWVLIGTATAGSSGAGQFLDGSGNQGECRMYKLVETPQP